MASSVSTKAMNFALPIHHEPEGPTDFTSVRLPSPFVVLVAGGSRGIGLGTAKAFAAAGASDIIIIARSQGNIDLAAQEIREAYTTVKVTTFSCDITEENQVKDLATKVWYQFQRLDVLIINAGISSALVQRASTGLKDFPATFPEQSCDDFKRVMAVNFIAPFLLLHYFTSLLQATVTVAKAGAPAVIQISSATAWFVDPAMAPWSYSLSKLAVTRLIEHFHVAHHRHGINAFSVQPGGVKTGLSFLSQPEGKGWFERMINDRQLCGAMCVWLTKEKRDWLSGRYIDARWDIDELLRRKGDIIDRDLLRVSLAL